MTTIERIKAFKNRSFACKKKKEVDVDGAILTETSLDFIKNLQADNNEGIIEECKDLDKIVEIMKSARNKTISNEDFIFLMDGIDWIRDIFIDFTNPLSAE
ncbi:MAG: hypothetical protein LBS88_07295 [Tannerellaceae bacterium]|jgi:hypothetical protein|nr:hypothetical protein [Tannerellaceae bacterium]